MVCVACHKGTKAQPTREQPMDKNLMRTRARVGIDGKVLPLMEPIVFSLYVDCIVDTILLYDHYHDSTSG